jgi:Glycosyl hydrolase family 26
VALKSPDAGADSRWMRLRYLALPLAAGVLALPAAVADARPHEPAVASTTSAPRCAGQARTADRQATRRKAMRFGIYAPRSPEGGLDETERLERRLGHPIGIVNWYQHWGGWGRDFEPEWIDNVVRSGRIPLLTWEPWEPGPAEQPDYALTRIARGDFDPYVRAWARAAAVYGKTFYLRPMHEMNGDWYPWGGTVGTNSAARYVAAWQRLWEIFREERATNVKWVWSPNHEDVPATPANAFERYYPGTRYVDVLALDGYNWGGERPEHGGWRSFDAIFACAYRRVAALGPQPVWVAETASAPEGGDKAAWVKEMFDAARRYPRLQAVVWFHADKERDWRATSSRRVARAFAASRL